MITTMMTPTWKRMKSFYFTRYLISGLPSAGGLKASYLNHHKVPSKMTAETDPLLSTINGSGNGFIRASWGPLGAPTFAVVQSILVDGSFNGKMLRFMSKIEFSAAGIAQNCSILSLQFELQMPFFVFVQLPDSNWHCIYYMVKVLDFRIFGPTRTQVIVPLFDGFPEQVHVLHLDRSLSAPPRPARVVPENYDSSNNRMDLPRSQVA